MYFTHFLAQKKVQSEMRLIEDEANRRADEKRDLGGKLLFNIKRSV